MQRRSDGPLGRAPTPAPRANSFVDGELIPSDATGIDDVRRLWNDLRPDCLPACETLEYVEKQAIARIISADDRHQRRAWWVRWIERTHTAKLLPRKFSGPAALGWFVEDVERIAKLLRGEYDRDPDEKRGAQTYRRPAHYVDYSAPDFEEGDKS